MAQSFFTMLLNVLLALLLVIFVYLAYRRLIKPSESSARKSLLREKDFDEGEILDVLDERFELREEEKELKNAYLMGRIDVNDFREKHHDLQLRLKTIERRLKLLGVLG